MQNTGFTRHPIQDDELQSVLSHYNIGSLTTPPVSGEGTANTNLKLETESGCYFLKKRNVKYSAESFVEFDHALMEHLSRYKIGTPLATPAADGRRWVRLKEDVYELFPYQPGDPHNRHSLPQIASAGKALAVFHNAAQSFSPPEGKDWPRYDDPAIIRSGLGQVQQELESRANVEDIHYLFSQVQLLEQKLSDERYHSLPKLVVHGDYHPGNLKFNTNDVCGIFDLDWATLQPRVRDIADGIIFFAGERASDIDAADIVSLTQTWQPSANRTRVFMKAYLAHTEPLNKEETSSLPLFIRARWLYCRFGGMIKVSPEQRVQYLMHGLLEPLQALDSVPQLLYDK